MREIEVTQEHLERLYDEIHQEELSLGGRMGEIRLRVVRRFNEAIGLGWIDSASENRAGGEDFAWLIEHGASEPCKPRYWCGVHGWTYEHERAVRFAREVDAQSQAEAMDDGFPGNYRIAEHGWIGPKPDTMFREQHARAMEALREARDELRGAHTLMEEFDISAPMGVRLLPARIDAILSAAATDAGGE